jgi:hypothetical protein
MRTFNGLQIFTDQLTNSGQLDLRYPRITGNDQGANLIFGDNIQSNYNFYSDTNFNVTNYINIFYCTGTNGSYIASLPNITDKKMMAVYLRNDIFKGIFFNLAEKYELVKICNPFKSIF